jgi:hypothetical protein
MNTKTKTAQASTWLLAGCGVWLVCLGLYFIAVRPPLLPEDLRYVGTTLPQLRLAFPGLEPWLSKVFIVMGGFMAGAGVLTFFVASAAMRRGLEGTTWALALAGALSVGLMSASNFALDSDFKWLLLAPLLVWSAGLALFIADR